MSTALQPLTERQENLIHGATEDWSNDFALKVVKRDFELAENYLIANHYHRWTNAFQLYVGWVRSRNWDGTRIPRSALSVFLIFEQIESLLPRYMSTVFGDSPWAEAEPMPGTTAEDARIARDFILDQFDETKGRSHIRRAFKSALLNGNGIIEGGWKYSRQEKLKWVPGFKPQFRNVVTPFGTFRIPDGLKRTVKKTKVKEEINAPFIKYVSLKDFFIDPNTESPSVQDARFAGKRALLSIDEILAFKDQDGFTIPVKDTLLEMVRSKSTSQADSSKSDQASFRGESWNPAIDTSKDPASGRLEVVSYYTKERLVWMLNREMTIFNDVNKYEEIPFYNVFYTDVLDRFYGLSVSDVVEGDQRLIKGILDARIDELSLGIHRTRIKKRGGNTPAYQFRVRPGAVLEEDEQGDIRTEDVPNITQQAFQEVTAAQSRTQRTVGLVDAITGNNPSGGNAALRTAAGVNRVGGGADMRHLYLIENAEFEFIEPILNFFLKMDQRFLDPNKSIIFKGQKKESQEADPLQVMNAELKFKMRASARQRSKANLSQFFPLMLETFMNPGILELLAKQQGKTIDIEEIGNIFFDMADYRPRGGIFRDMTEEEKQQQGQPPVEELIRKQMQDDRLKVQSSNQQKQLEAKSSDQDAKSNIDLLMELIKDFGQQKQLSAKSQDLDAKNVSDLVKELMKGKKNESKS